MSMLHFALNPSNEYFITTSQFVRNGSKFATGATICLMGTHLLAIFLAPTRAGHRLVAVLVVEST